MSSSSAAADHPRSLLLLTRSLNVGGAERQLVELARGLSARGHRVAVAVFYRGGLLERELEQQGIPIIDLGKAGRWDVIGFLFRLRRELVEFRPAVVYAFLGTANIVAALVRPFCPPFRLVWSIRASNMDPRSYDWVMRLGYWIERRLSRSADLIISNSQAGRDFAAANGFPRARMVVIPNGIDTDRFRPAPAVRARMRAHWGLAPSDIAIGVLARLDPMKDHGNFIRAAAMLGGHEPRARFLCVGEGSPAIIGQLTRLAEELGLGDRLRFTGRHAAAEALPAFDICCSSSAFGEGFSNAVAEAMACGVPCVVTDVGDSAAIVGETGIVVPPGDPLRLAAGLEQMFERTDADASTASRQRIVDQFSVQAMVAATAERIFRQL